MINTNNLEIIRKPIVAGSYYPANQNELNASLDNYFANTKKIKTSGKLRILIVPHAGIVYSGQTAAWGFKQIEGQNYKRIIILGNSHHFPFDNAAVFTQGIWKTPLGSNNVDSEFANKLLDGDYIVSNKDYFWDEQILEIEQIFLQKALKDFEIVPVLLGQVSPKTIQTLAEKISNNFDNDTLLIISSDLSHYPSWKIANKVDSKTIESITSGNVEEFEKTLLELSEKNYPSLETCACGSEAIKVALEVARILKFDNFQKIYYENSGDISGDKSRVVGYGAVGVWGEKTSNVVDYLDKISQKEALTIARKTLENYFSKHALLEIKPQNQKLLEHLGAFVTLKKHEELRGCIGLFEPDFPLYEVIQRMAIAAAIEDTRFLPVTQEELPEIKIEISVMTPKKKIDDWKKIVLGKHGVVIQNSFRSGTFLSQVAVETGWNLEEFLSQLCTQKAGLPPDCYLDPQTEIYTFEAQVFSE